MVWPEPYVITALRELSVNPNGVADAIGVGDGAIEADGDGATVADGNGS